MEHLKMDNFLWIFESLSSYINLDFKLLLSRIGTVILSLFLLPVMIQVLMGVTTTTIGLYKFYYTKVLKKQPTFKTWRPVQQVIARFWDLYGRIYYGYEVHGLENIPEDKSALIIYFHGTLPMDMYFFQARMTLQGRLLYTVVDKFFFNIVPGYKNICDIVSAIPGTRDSCIDILNTGNILTIAPGGTHESMLGDNNYTMHWKDRVGFAKVALASQTTVLPLFTENIQEAYRMAHYGPMKQFFDWVYRSINIPICLVYGGFPVKLRTYVGRPIQFDFNTTPQQLKVRVMAAIYYLRDKHQRLPGSIPHALIDRFRSKNTTEFINDENRVGF